MILVIDIGNTNIKFTGLAGCSLSGNTAMEEADFSVLFEDRLSTETGKDLQKFLCDAEQLLGQHGISFLSGSAA